MSDQPNEDLENSEPEPLNRAERRAAAKGKGKGKGQQQAQGWNKGAGQVAKGQNAGGPRIWANRKAG